MKFITDCLTWSVPNEVYYRLFDLERTCLTWSVPPNRKIVDTETELQHIYLWKDMFDIPLLFYIFIARLLIF